MAAYILVVDDDAPIRRLIASTLEFEGYDVEVAADGMAALAAIARRQPSLMLLDMQMPVLDGWGVARCLREQGRHVPTVAMTAAVDAPRWCAEIQADACLGKPFDLDELVATVERVCAA